MNKTKISTEPSITSFSGGGVQSISTQAVSNESSLGTPPNNEIWYTSTDGNIVTPISTTGFGANIVTNTYENGKGVISFDGDVTSIGDSAFYNNLALTSVIIPNSVTSIKSYAFYDCESLSSITIPNSVTSIGNFTFRYCNSLASVTIPDSVTSIENTTFFGCSSIDSIKVEEGNTVYNSRNNCNAIIKTVTNSVILGCKSTIIPNGVTSIENNAFNNCSGLTSVTIPNSVTIIGSSAFDACSSLTSVTIPDSVTSIYSFAFYGCSGLTSITIPNSVTIILGNVFSNCRGLTSVTIEAQNPPTFGPNVFSGCSKLSSIYVPSKSVEAYKTSTNFATYAYKIKAIPPQYKSFLDLSGLKTFWNKIKSMFVSSATSDTYLKVTSGSTKTIDIDSDKLAKSDSADAGTKLATDGYVLEQITNNASDAITTDEIDKL